MRAAIFDVGGVLALSGKPNDPLLRVLHELRTRGLRVFALSNNASSADFPFVVAHVERGYFAGETGLYKPNPHAYKLILGENELAARECVYFDDMPAYVAAATHLGIHGYLYENPQQVARILGLPEV